MGETAGRSLSGLHDEDLEKEKGGKDLAIGKLMKNLNHQKKELTAVMKTGYPERSPVLRIEVVFLDFELLILGYPHLTPPTGRWGFHLRVGSRTGGQFAKISLFL